jgi:hypothetical protein
MYEPGLVFIVYVFTIDARMKNESHVDGHN